MFVPSCVCVITVSVVPGADPGAVGPGEDPLPKGPFAAAALDGELSAADDAPGTDDAFAPDATVDVDVVESDCPLVESLPPEPSFDGDCGLFGELGLLVPPLGEEVGGDVVPGSLFGTGSGSGEGAGDVDGDEGVETRLRAASARSIARKDPARTNTGAPSGTVTMFPDEGMSTPLHARISGTSQHDRDCALELIVGRDAVRAVVRGRESLEHRRVQRSMGERSRDRVCGAPARCRPRAHGEDLAVALEVLHDELLARGKRSRDLPAHDPGAIEGPPLLQNRCSGARTARSAVKRTIH